MAANPKLSGDNIAIERPSTRQQFDEFARLPFQVYAARDAWWPPDVQNEVDLLSRRSLLATHLELMPLCACRAGRIVARVSAVVNRRYIDHWNEQLGQLIQFEALEGEDVAVAAMLDQAVQSLRDRGMRSVRTGFAAFLDYPYAIDNYDSLPSFLLRGNPASYHTLLQGVGLRNRERAGRLYRAAHTRNPRALPPDGRRCRSCRRYDSKLARVRLPGRDRRLARRHQRRASTATGDGIP